MYKYENDLLKKGYKLIAGVDEVGRGPLAGPLVSAAVILDVNNPIAGLNDSKKLSEKKREILYKEITEKAISVVVEFIWQQEIDKINILNATKKAMKICLNKTNYDYVLIDAVDLGIENSLSIIKGDTLSASIAAASIIAKVTRDRYMVELSKKHPDYGFEKHKGYGTKLHIECIKKYKPIEDVHRHSYEPIKSMNK